MLNNFFDYIPQRPPFLFIDNVHERSENSITTSYTVKSTADYLSGHFPGFPVMPGVLMCEAVFQTGALLMGLKGLAANQNKTALVTRIQNAKFKNMVRPDSTLLIKVDFVEMLANAAFMKGKVTNGDKTALTIEFSCTLVDA